MIDSLLGAVTAAGIRKTAECITFAALAGVESYTNSMKEMKQLDARLKSMDMAMNQNPNNYVQMRVEAGDFLNQDFREVVRNLAGMGFYDINIKKRLLKKGIFQQDQTGLVTRVIINGSEQFDSLSVFPKNSHVVVEAIVHNREDILFMPELIEIRKGPAEQKKTVMRCAYCGTRVSDGQKYCIGCGAPV